MPLFGKGSSKGIDYKARLEHKLYLAREDPDPVFDLSDCDLKAVPSGVYSLCKVFRKESLLLQKNNLSSLSGGGCYEDLSLLKILDLRKNHFSNLPNEIDRLHNLEELYLNNNLLKTLPESICSLSKLKVLSLSFNKVKQLPPRLGSLSELRALFLQGNPALCVLPNSLWKATNLDDLVLDPGRLTHPPDRIVLQGTHAILAFLASQVGEEYKGNVSPVTHHEPVAHHKQLSTIDQRNKLFQEKLEKLEKQKDEKLQERLAMEKEISEQKEKELRLQNIIKVSKDKLMEDLMKQQSKIAKEVVRFQNKKEAERTKLIEELQKVEEEADEVIKQMLVMNSCLREPSAVLAQQEADRLAQEQLFSKHSEQLRRKEVLSAMESLLDEERVQRDKLREYEEMKAQVVKDTLSREEEWEGEVRRLVEESGSRSRAVAEASAAGAAAQTLAVATLLRRCDSESRALTAKLLLIERQLATLTQLELHRSKLNNDQLQCDLSEKRTALSILLVEVLNEQQERKNQLLKTLRKMERYRLEELEGEESEDYWLVQYQRILDSRPQFLVELDSRLVHCLVQYGVVHCLPLLAKCQQLNSLTDQYLLQLGVKNEEDRQGILKAVFAYLEEATASSAQLTPSAPPLEVPSAPPQLASECIVCMQSECEVVFVPCGHLCCCISCSERLSDCPLCRSKLERKLLKNHIAQEFPSVDILS